MTRMVPGLTAVVLGLALAAPAPAAEIVTGGKVAGRILPGLEAWQSVYAAGSLVGTVAPVSASRWNATTLGGLRAGYATRRGARWEIRAAGALVGIASKARRRWNISRGVARPKVGYVDGGGGGPAAAAALLVLLG